MFPNQQGKYPAPLSKLLIRSLKRLLVPNDPDLRPNGALLRFLRGTPASGGHPDPAAGQTPVFGRAARNVMAVVFAFAFG